jgi:radical SAM superfamily enzyme YgiQ (UPF0313 family)
MTTVLLVYPKTGEEKWRETYVPPFSVLALAYWLKKHDITDLYVYDQRVEPESQFLKLLHKCSPKSIIGFSTMTGPQIAYSLDLAKKAREHCPESQIIFGGVHPSFTPETTVSNPLIDIVVRGEGEQTLLELVTRLENGGKKDLRKINGITFKHNGKIINTPDRSPIPRHAFDETGFLWNYNLLEKYIDVSEGERWFSFMTSRGCPYRCTFCYNSGFWHRVWRGWSVERTIEEIVKLSSHVKFDVINFFDDNFFPDTKRAIQILRSLKELNISGWGSGGIRTNQFNRRLGKIFKETGCKQVYIGAESASQRMLDYLHKDIRVEEILESAKICREFGLHIYLSFMVGLPTQTRKDIFKTLDMIDKVRKIQPNSGIAIAIYLPLPGGELYSEAIKEGFNPPKKFEDWATLTFLSGLDESPLWLKTLLLCNYILHYKWEGKKRAYNFLNVFKPFEKIRWKLRFFGFPIEGYLYEKNIFNLFF